MGGICKSKYIFASVHHYYYIISYNSQDIYSIMLQCWNEEPLNRPAFSMLVEDFNRLLTNASESMYLDMGEVFSMASKSTGETLIAGKRQI